MSILKSAVQESRAAYTAHTNISDILLDSVHHDEHVRKKAIEWIEALQNTNQQQQQQQHNNHQKQKQKEEKENEEAMNGVSNATYDTKTLQIQQGTKALAKKRDLVAEVKVTNKSCYQ